MAIIINLFGNASSSEAPAREAALVPIIAPVPAKRVVPAAVAKAIANGFHNPDAGPGLDVASLTRIALRWVRRGGRKMSSLPQLIRMELDAHCRAGDPTARLIRDWIEGKSPLVSGASNHGSSSERPLVASSEEGRGQ